MFLGRLGLVSLIDAGEPTKTDQGVWLSGGVLAFSFEEEPKARGSAPTNMLVGSLANQCSEQPYRTQPTKTRRISAKALLCIFLNACSPSSISSAVSRKVFSSK